MKLSAILLCEMKIQETVGRTYNLHVAELMNSELAWLPNKHDRTKMRLHKEMFVDSLLRGQ